MNFLRTFLIILLSGLVLTVAGLFIGREVVLYVAANQVARDAQTITQLGSYQKLLTHCLQGGSGTVIYNGVQLRFLNNEDYVLEINCAQTTPWQWQQRKLPWGVHKTVGTAGFRYDQEQRVVSGEITISWMNENKTIRFVDGRARQRWGSSVLTAPVVTSSCQAYGLLCCDNNLSVGQGKQISEGVSDCADSCFSSCRRRPLLLSFQSDPEANYETRLVAVNGSSALVLFSYAFDEGAAPIQEVAIDYGNGEVERLSGAQGQIAKQFSCTRFPCRYQVTVQATDTDGVVSVNNRLSSLIVEMKPE